MYPVLNASCLPPPPPASSSRPFPFLSVPFRPVSRAPPNSLSLSSGRCFFSPGAIYQGSPMFLCLSKCAVCACARAGANARRLPADVCALVVKWQPDEKGFTAIPSTREELRRSGCNWRVGSTVLMHRSVSRFNVAVMSRCPLTAAPATSRTAMATAN